MEKVVWCWGKTRLEEGKAQDAHRIVSEPKMSEERSSVERGMGRPKNDREEALMLEAHGGGGETVRRAKETVFRWW